MSEHLCYVKMVGITIARFQAQFHTMHGSQRPQMTSCQRKGCFCVVSIAAFFIVGKLAVQSWRYM